MSLRVVIADDHPIYRRGLRAQIDLEPDIEVVGEVATAQDAVIAVTELKPAVMLLDLHMPECQGKEPTYSGIEAIKEIRRAGADTVIVVLTMHHDDGQIRQALAAGARGILVKEEEHTDIAAKLRLAARGDGVFSPRVAERLQSFISEAGSGRAARSFPELSDRQHEILDLVARGKRNGEIALVLGITRKAVENRISEIKGRLDARNRDELIAIARDNGLGGEPAVS